jgi:hypothetical protein
MNKRVLARIGIFIGGVALAAYWWMAIGAFVAGRLFAYANYWGAPVGTITVLMLLVVLTPLWVWASWRYWNWRGHVSADR